MVVGEFRPGRLHNNFDSSIPEGASGTGRTTFVNTLCESDVLAHKVIENPQEAHIEVGIKIKPANVGQWFLNCVVQAFIPDLSEYSLQSLRRMVFESRLPSLIPRGSETTLTTNMRPSFSDNTNSLLKILSVSRK